MTVEWIFLILLYTSWWFTLSAFNVWFNSFEEKVWPMVWTAVYLLGVVLITALELNDYIQFVLFGVPSVIIWCYLFAKVIKIRPVKNSMKLLISTTLMILLGFVVVILSVLY